MRRVLAIAGGLIVGSVATGAVAFRTAGERWDRRTRELADRLASGSRPLRAGPAGDVPPPVLRYLARALADAPGPIRSVRVEQQAEMVIRPENGWAPLTATQYFRVEPPAFVWDATVRMLPLVPVRVRDSYLEGTGAMVASVGGLLPVVHQSGSPELAAGALTRLLGEAVWFPTRLLPSANLSWAPVDDRSATATLVDGGTTVSARFRFDRAGDPVEVYSEDRMREVDGAFVPTPWIVQLSEHRPVEGVRVPTYARVGWRIDGRDEWYWRGRVVGLRYDFGSGGVTTRR